MKEKTTEELINEFLAKGGKIEKLPAVPYEVSYKVSSTTKSAPELKTLAEGELLYGAKSKSRKKKKKVDYSNINMELIPDHIKSLLKYDKKEEELTKPNNGGHIETNKNSRSSKASDKS